MFKYLALFIKPAGFALAVSLFWINTLYPLHLGEDTEISANYATCLLAFSLLVPSIILGIGFVDSRKTKTLIQNFEDEENDKKRALVVSRFREHIKGRVPGIAYAVAGILGLISIIFVGIVEYKSFKYGVTVLSLISYIQYLLFMCCYELEDPLSGRFKRKDVPDKLKAAVKDIEPTLLDRIAAFLF